MTPLFAMLGPGTIAVLAIFGVVVFGRRLPEFARYFGKAFVEFKKGMNGLEDDLDLSARPSTSAPQAAAPPSEAIRAPQRIAAAAPRFEEVPQA